MNNHKNCNLVHDKFITTHWSTQPKLCGNFLPNTTFRGISGSILPSHGSTSFLPLPLIKNSLKGEGFWRFLNVQTEFDTATERSPKQIMRCVQQRKSYWNEYPNRRGLFQNGFGHHHGKFSVVSITPSVWILFKQAWLFANKQAVYICPNYRNVHKIRCRQCENFFLSGFDVNLLQVLWRTDVEVQI